MNRLNLRGRFSRLFYVQGIPKELLALDHLCFCFVLSLPFSIGGYP